MMVSITHYYKNKLHRPAFRALWILALCWTAGVAHADSAEISQVRVERLDDDLVLSAQVAFELPPAVEDAMIKGIPMAFVMQADISRERWYWYDKRVVNAERHIRIAFQPLTRRWRLNIAAGQDRGSSPGLALNQSFETLAQALAVVKRTFRWKIADASDVDGSSKNRLELKFRLDLSFLPRPFQIGAIGQSDWDIAATYYSPLIIDAAK